MAAKATSENGDKFRKAFTENKMTMGVFIPLIQQYAAKLCSRSESQRTTAYNHLRHVLNRSSMTHKTLEHGLAIIALSKG